MEQNPHNSLIHGENRALPNDQVPDVVEMDLQECCVQTIKHHAANNPMMMCPDCKQIVKCFRDEKTFRNYVKFCKSRHRKIAVTRFGEMQVVLYRTFSKFA